MEEVQHTFGRVPTAALDGLDPEQRALLDDLAAKLGGKLPRAIVGIDGRITGAFNYLLLDPTAGGHVISLGDSLSRDLPARLREIVVLQSSRILESEYEWKAHEPVARRVGVTEEELRHLRDGSTCPSFSTDETVAREVVTAVLTTTDLPDEMFNRASQAFGLSGLWQITMIAGYYSMMVATLRAFRAPLLVQDTAQSH